jgi:hypothetical protein
MVCAEVESLRETARSKLGLADSALEQYRQVVSDADFAAARQYLRNARNHLDDGHFTAVISNADSVIEAVNQAVFEALKQRLALEVGPLRTNIEEARRLYWPVPELDALENSLAELEQELFRLRPAVAYYCSQKLFTQIPEVVSRFNRCLNALRLEQLQRERFEVKAVQISDLLKGIRDRYPQANRIERERLEKELERRKAAFETQPSEQVLQGSGIRDLEDLLMRVKELHTRVSSAFRPPSNKKVPQRGRDRVPRKSSRGPGHHSGR